MKLYIPEIGDEIILAEDWNFILFPEHRNSDLAALSGYYLHQTRIDNYLISGWVDEKEVPYIRDQDYHPNYPEYPIGGGRIEQNKYYDLRKKAEEDCPEWVKYWEDYKIWKDECDAKWIPILNMELKAGQLLKIDRIYVRKGASDFSSVTFYAKGMPEVRVRNGSMYGVSKGRKKKSLRFWVKLSDCNEINFEKAQSIL